MDTGRPKLLLADDSITIQKVIGLTFSDEGMEVVLASDGDEAMRHLADDTPPDIVLADVLLPGLSGYEVCRRIKAHSRFQHIPVVLLVGAFELFNEAEARQAGADQILTKPFQSIRDLVSKVGSLLGGESKPEAEAESHDESPPPSPSSRPQPFPPAGSRVADTVRREPAAHTDFDSVAAQPAGVTLDPSASFADLVMDDQMIEAKPADRYEDAPTQSHSVEPPAPMLSRADASSGDASGDMASERGVSGDEGRDLFAARKVGNEVLAGQPQQHAFAARFASAGDADDALLDLGGDNLAPATAEADDFVLDLEDDLPSPQRVAAHDDDVFDLDAPAYEWPESAGETGRTAVADNAAHPEQSRNEFESAEMIEAEAIPQHRVPFTMSDEGGSSATTSRAFIEPTVVPAEESAAAVAGAAESHYADDSVEGDVARPPAVVGSETMAGSVGRARAGIEQLVGLEQLSPEAIDAIARRAVEMLSEKVVQEIAWEVVPQLAELLIRQRLDEESRKG
ncbi:MAG: response regulator [Pyrinomonadaceae bacterium]